MEYSFEVALEGVVFPLCWQEEKDLLQETSVLILGDVLAIFLEDIPSVVRG